jgi:hypothetical protein
VKTRRIIGLVLAVLGLPLLFVGLIDPLEGGIALMLGALLGLAAWLVSRVPVPKFTWISFLVSIGLGILTLLAAVILRDPVAIDSATGEATATNPFATVPIAIILLWLYRLSVLVTLAGGIYYVVRIARATAGVEEGAPSGSHRGVIAIGIAAAALLAAVGVGAAVGFGLVLVLFAALRERLESAEVPSAFKGAPIALVTAGLMALAFAGFTGMDR